MAWSYGLLSTAEQRALAQLSVFAGSFTLDAAEAVIGGDVVAIDDVVADLIDKSLIRRDGRWLRMLETTRQFASERLVESSELESTRLAHTRFIVAEVEQIHPFLRGRDEAAWVRVLDEIWPDVRVTMRRCLDTDDADSVISLVTHLALEAFFRRTEACAWAIEAVQRYGERDGPHRAELLGAGGLAAFVGQDPDTAAKLGEQAMAMVPRPGAALDCLPEWAAYAVYLLSGRNDQALAIGRRGVASLSDSNDLWKKTMMQQMVSLALVIGDEDPHQQAEEADLGLTLARTTCNSTLIIIATYVQAVHKATTDPPCRPAPHRGHANVGFGGTQPVVPGPISHGPGTGPGRQWAERRCRHRRPQSRR